MAIRLATATRNAAADGVVDRVDVGTTELNGFIRVYSGAQPASANDAPSGTLLAEWDAQDPAFGAAASGTATLQGTPIATTGTDTGTAGWFRLVNRDEATVLDGSVTATGGGGDMEVDNTSIASGQTVNLTSMTVTMPSGE